jgi:hypothetical protein
MQSPLASRIDQPIADQRLQDMLPAGSFARVRQPRRPEPIQFKMLIEVARKPTRAPLPRAMQLHRIQPDLYPIVLGMLWHRGRKQRQLLMALALFVEGLDQSAPRVVLAVVDLAEIQDRSLDHPAAGATLALHNTPIAILFAVSASLGESQVHDAEFYRKIRDLKKVFVLLSCSLHRFSTHRPLY